MRDQAYPEGLPRTFRTRIDDELYASARTLFERERFADSLCAAREALQRAGGEEARGQEPCLRDGALLVAWNLHQLRRYDECRGWLRTAAAEGLLPEDDPRAEVVDLWIAWSEGRHREVVTRACRRVERYAGRLHPLLAEFLFIRGNALGQLGRYAEAREDCGAAYHLFKLLHRRREQAEACNVIGTTLLQQSRYRDAVRWLQESLELNQDLGLARRVGSNCTNLGIAHYKRGEYAAARSHLTRAVALQDEAGASHAVCRARIALGNVCRLERDFAGARRNLMAAYTLASEQRLPREECLALEFLGDVLRDEGKPREARRYYARGMALARHIAPGGDLVQELTRRDGECLLLLGRVAEAQPVLERARALAAKLGDRFEEGVALRCLAAAAVQRRDWPAAGSCHREARDRLEASEARHELARTHLQAAAALDVQAEAAPAAGGSLRREALQQALLAQHLYSELAMDQERREADEMIARLTRAVQLAAAAEAGGGADTAAACDAPAAERPGVPAPENAGELVAVSSALRATLRQAEAFAPFPEAVLIRGETGTGKELIARRIHELSPRCEKPFVAVNCAAIPATLFEREFFGNRKGAYSGADDDNPGFVALADGGTLFLDEVGELPWELQPKLLRLLQDGTYTRLGDPRERRADVRLLAATNANLDALAEQGRFRQDLNYRLKVLELELPPLRKRPDDVIPLLDHYLTRFSGRSVTVWSYFDENSVRALQRYAWPGNVREIIMAARRAHIGLATEGRVHVQIGNGEAPLILTGPGAGAAPGAGDRERVLAALDDTGGNKAAAARRLGVSRQTLYRWLRRIESEEK
jgi:DNA-binding NtrC family response regulator/tetratricopeptide (TPR) repeat protein